MSPTPTQFETPTPLATTTEQKDDHSPQFRKFGKVSDVTQTAPFAGSFVNDSAGFSGYAS